MKDDKKLLKNVLLIDDDEDDRMIFKIVVEDINPDLHISTAKNGEEGLTVLRQEGAVLPELIFLDINMPVVNGFECLEEIKKDKRLSHIPVVMYSTSSIDKQVAKAFDLGAHLYIVKPFNMDGYHEIMRKVLSPSFAWTVARTLRENFLFNEKAL